MSTETLTLRAISEAHEATMCSQSATPNSLKTEESRIVNIGIFAWWLVLNLIASVLLAGDATAVIASATPEEAAQAVEVWGSVHMVAMCFLGSSLGTMAKVAWLLRKKSPQALQKENGVIAQSAVISMCTGLAATPFVLDQAGWIAGKDPVVYVAAAVAFASDVVLTAVLKFVENWPKGKGQ